MAQVLDEHGNPVQLTDERGNQVQLTDEFGNPMHLTGVATTGSKLASCAGDVGQTQLVREHDRSPRRSTSSSSSEARGEEMEEEERTIAEEKVEIDGKRKTEGGRAERHKSTNVTSAVDVQHQEHGKKRVTKKMRE